MKFLITVILFLFSMNAFAIFCPTNFSSIDFGDSIEQVKNLCGAPNSERTYQLNKPNAEEWEYYVRLKRFDPTTTKMTVVFKKGEVININIADGSANSDLCKSVGQIQNNPQLQMACRELQSGNSGPVNVSSTTACGQIISIGDSSDVVKTACGNPIAVKPLDSSESPSTPIEMTEFTYNGPPVVKLIFENGVLKERK